MALQALWPLLAQARPRSVTLVPICTVDGVTHYFELKNGDTPLDRQSASHHEHCAYCSFDNGRTVGLPTAPVFFLPSFTSDAPAERCIVPVALPLRHPPARPRAPPASLLI